LLLSACEAYENLEGELYIFNFGVVALWGLVPECKKVCESVSSAVPYAKISSSNSKERYTVLHPTFFEEESTTTALK
jgi:hypothetical protein